MRHRAFEKWIPHGKVDAVYDMEDVGWVSEEGFVLSLLPDHLEPGKRSAHILKLVWEDVLCYQVTQEQYRPDWWISDPSAAWTFYTSTSSDFLKQFRTGSDLVPKNVYHFAVVGTHFIIDILSEEYPALQFLEGNNTG